MSKLKLFLLGAPRIEHGDAQIKLPRHKSLALLIYLAATARECSRETLATLFWPDVSDAQSRQALRTALSDIRRAVGKDHLSADAETVSFSASSDLWTDVRELETLAREPLRESKHLLRIAPFLEGFNLKDAPGFDDWVSFERDRLTQLAIKTLRARADAHEARGELTQAIAAARQLLELDSVHEETHRQLMRLHYAAGDRAAALQQYETARAQLERELGVQPMEETRALHRQILDEAKTIVPAPTQRQRASRSVDAASGRAGPRLPFIGRELECAELQHAWQIAKGGRAQFVFVEGEAGVGKTRLIEETLAEWGSEALILRGTAHQWESMQPYHPFIDILRDYFGNVSATPIPIPEIWLSELGRLLPELRQARPNLPPVIRLQAAQERNRLFEAIGQFSLALAERQPLVLFLDDVQWADPSTLALLAFLSNSFAHARVLVVCAYRSAESNTDLENLTQALSRVGALARMALHRLNPQQVCNLIEAMSQQDCAAFAEWLFRESEGNPFFIRELIAYLIANNLVKTNEQGWQTDLDQLVYTLPKVALPSGIHDLICARVQSMSELARQLLDVAAIIGHDFDFATLWRASGKDEDLALDAFDELLNAQFVQQTANTPNPYEFTHPKIREVVLEDMSLARQQILHRRVGESLRVTQPERLPELGGILALHFGSAGEWAKAAQFAHAAGDRALAVLALQEAVEFYGSALESLSHLDDLEATARAHMGLGEACAMLGLLDRFYESYAHALAIWDQLGERERVAAVRFRMGMFHVFRTEYDQAYELAQAGLRDLAGLEQPDKRVVAQGHVLWATALANEGRALKDAQAHLSQAIQLYEQTDDYDGRCQAQIELGNIAAQEGELEQAVAYYEQALENAQRGKELMSEAMAFNNAAYHSLLLGDVEKANQLVQRGLTLAEAHNITPVLLNLYNTVAEIRLSEKRWDEAEEFLKKGMALAEQLNSPERRGGYLANFAEVAYGRGEHPAAIAQLTAATQFADQIGTRHASARYHIRLAEILGEQGKWPEAESHLQRGKQIAREGNYRRLLEQAERISRRNR